MLVKEFDYLPEDAKKIRVDVFVNEQGFLEEFDDIDDVAKHLVMYDNNIAIATCRIYFNQEHNCFVVGRIAVIKALRGKNIGAAILKASEEVILKAGGNRVMLSAQVRIAEFYKKQGYIQKGEIFLDESCPHIWMEKFK